VPSHGPTDRRYARFYYPEFVHDYPDVYADDAAFATWMRLLVTAEQMCPMDPEIPRSTRSKPLSKLVDRGLVATDGRTYAIKGHAAERDRRSQTGRNAAAVRWESERNANALPSTSTRTSTKGVRGVRPLDGGHVNGTGHPVREKA
jgi:hypothetical protein